MPALTGYHDKVLELMSDEVNHGWGEGRWSIQSLKDNTIKIELISGKSYVFFVKKEIIIDQSKLL